MRLVICLAVAAAVVAYAAAPVKSPTWSTCSGEHGVKFDAPYVMGSIVGGYAGLLSLGGKAEVLLLKADSGALYNGPAPFYSNSTYFQTFNKGTMAVMRTVVAFNYTIFIGDSLSPVPSISMNGQVDSTIPPVYVPISGQRFYDGYLYTAGEIWLTGMQLQGNTSGQYSWTQYLPAYPPHSQVYSQLLYDAQDQLILAATTGRNSTHPIYAYDMNVGRLMYEIVSPLGPAATFGVSIFGPTMYSAGLQAVIMTAAQQPLVAQMAVVDTATGAIIAMINTTEKVMGLTAHPHSPTVIVSAAHATTGRASLLQAINVYGTKYWSIDLQHDISAAFFVGDRLFATTADRLVEVSRTSGAIIWQYNATIVNCGPVGNAVVCGTDARKSCIVGFAL